MKILHVVEASGGGVGRHVLDLSEGLVARGHDVHLVYSPRREGPFFRRRREALDGVRTHAVSLRRAPHPLDLMALKSVRDVIEEGGAFDVVHGHSSKGGAVARLAVLGTGIPAVYTPNAISTLNPAAPEAWRRALGWVERLLARVDGAVIAVSPNERAHLAGLGIPEARLYMVPNCVREVELPTREEARAGLGLPPTSTVVGFVGRLTPQKGPEIMLEAFATVAREHPDVVLAMVGDGSMRPELEARARRLALRDAVRWLGERHGQRSMPAFDMLVLPSRYEGLPYVLLEGLVAGLPIVTTETANAGLVVEQGVNGLVVPGEDPGSVARAILRLLRNEEERTRFGRASRTRAARFSPDRMVEDTLRVYREVRGEGAGKPRAARDLPAD